MRLLDDEEDFPDGDCATDDFADEDCPEEDCSGEDEDFSLFETGSDDSETSAELVAAESESEDENDITIVSPEVIPIKQLFDEPPEELEYMECDTTLNEPNSSQPLIEVVAMKRARKGQESDSSKKRKVESH